MTIKQKLEIILIAAGIMTFSTPMATARELENPRLVCDGSPRQVEAETKNYFIHICSQETREGDIPVIMKLGEKSKEILVFQYHWFVRLMNQKEYI